MTVSCTIYRDLFCERLSCVNLGVAVLICCCYSSRLSITIQYMCVWMCVHVSKCTVAKSDFQAFSELARIAKTGDGKDLI